MPVAWGEITAEEILASIKGRRLAGNLQNIFRGVCTDSRKIQPGELFWALQGDRFDGHDFAFKSIESGAAGVVVKEGFSIEISNVEDSVIIAVDDTLRALGDLAEWWRRQHDVRVVAITGSAGKTTTKEMTADILKMGGRTLRNQGNFNNLIGLPLTLLQLDHSYSNAVVEMGMNRPGEIGRLTEIANPDVGVLTNVGMAHFEGFGNLEGVARAKGELIEKISSKGRVIINGDDHRLMEMSALFKRKMVTFGLLKENQVRACSIQNIGWEGVSFDLEYDGDVWPVTLKVPGIQNVSNALAAAAVGFCMGGTPEHIVEGLEGFAGIKGRFMVIPLPGDLLLVDDTYNANPSSLKAAIESLKDLLHGGKRIIVGLGEMLELGDAAVQAHYEAGKKVAELNPRLFAVMGEHAGDMIAGAVKGGMEPGRGLVVADHDEMIMEVEKKMQGGDVVFLKGSRRMGLDKVVDGIRSLWPEG